MEYSRSTEFMPYVASLKNPVILKQVDDEALLFTGDHQVKPFCIAHGFDNATRSWAAGEYFSSLLNATITFEKQNGTLAYVYTLDHEDIFPLLEEQGLEPSAKNVRALMRDTDDLSDMSDYFSENICNANWISDEIDNAKDFLDQKDDTHSKANAVMLNSEQFAQDMDANRKERSNWAKNHDISEQQVEKSKSKKGAYLAPDTPVEDTSSETKERTKQKSTSLREATKEAKAASEQLSKEAKSAPAKETISIDNGVSL